MTKRLHWYITGDLVKVTALALIGFTLVMTVFAIMEPLRKQGLDAAGALTVIGCTFPAMLSLTLPVAALFAATIVYGRFAQDNELLACRASGIATLSLLKPALVLGVVVTAASLYLNNSVAPRMLGLAKGEALQADLRNVVFNQIRKRGYFCYEDKDSQHKYVIHAASVDEENNVFGGFMLADLRKSTDAVIVSAPAARITFRPDSAQGETYLEFLPYNPQVLTSGGFRLVQESLHPVELLLPNPIKEKPAWYDWNQLLNTLKDPFASADLRQSLVRIQRSVQHSTLGTDITEAINSGRSYDKLRRGSETYVLSAASAEPHRGQVKLMSTRGDDFRRPVEVRIIQDGREKQVLTAESGVVQARWSPVLEQSVASIKLAGPVAVRLGGQDQGSQRRGEWSVGELPIPEELSEPANQLTPQRIMEQGATFGDDPSIQKSITKFNAKVARLVNEIVAEMHGRMAYGSSCFLLVALGAALGLVFRGGHFISAFAISIVPAALVIVMVIMGKEMMKQPKVDLAYGLVAIWGGIAALGLASVAVYVHLARK